MTDELDRPIGTKEQTKLAPGSVLVREVKIEPPKIGSKAKLLALYCKHPDRAELIKLTAIKVKRVSGNTESLKRETLWFNVDSDGNVTKGGPVAEVMNYYNKSAPRQFENSAIDTELDATGYLVIKAY
jgi:hypothetical protein